MPTRANRDTNSYGMNVDNGARAPHTEIEDRFCQNIYPMRTIEIKYAILYLLSRHLMNTIYSTITSVVTFYSPHIPKLSAYALNINRGRGTS